MAASPPAPSAPLRVVVRCPRCARQYLAGALRPGERFRCACGEAVTVPAVEPREAEVVRCEACGAPRAPGDARCRFCGADFTSGEGERNTICPACAARVSDRARFCSHCGAAIAPETIRGEASTLGCPACGSGVTLRSRNVAALDGAVLECPRCAGLWIGSAVFERAVDAAEAASAADALPHAPAPTATVAVAPARYRPCPVCGRLMNRRNFGDRSGVILDVCAADGLWFDADELSRVLDWVRAGGLRASRARAAEESRARAAAVPAFPALLESEGDDTFPLARGMRLLGAALEALFERVHRG